eukprot:351123-Chlamydomonas_euryale.AAC.3
MSLSCRVHQFNATTERDKPPGRPRPEPVALSSNQRGVGSSAPASRHTRAHACTHACMYARACIPSGTHACMHACTQHTRA